MNEQDYERLREELKFGDLIRITWKGQAITGYYDIVESFGNRGRYKDATLRIIAKIPTNPRIFPNFKKEPAIKWNFYLSEIDNVEFLNRILPDSAFNWEEIK